MNVGELFVNLGIKGSEKTVDALTNVKKGLSETKSISFEAKAAIVSMVYGLEKLMSMSAQAGNGLSNFNTLTGISAQTIQQWQYAARQAGVAGEEVAGSFKSAQTAMTRMLMGEGAPKGMARLAELTGGITKEQIDEMAKNPVMLMQRLQQYAQKEQNIGLRNEVMKSFGLSEGMITALSKNAFRPEMLRRAPTYSDKEVHTLQKVDVAWANLGNKIQMAMGHFTSRHGLQLVNDISKITTEVFKLADAFMKLAEKLKIFELIGKSFEGWTEIFKGATSLVEGKVSGGDILTGAKEAFQGWILEKQEQNRAAQGLTETIAPKVNAPMKSGSQQNNNINLDLHFQHDGKDHKKTSESVKKAVQGAFRQLSAQGQGS